MRLGETLSKDLCLGTVLVMPEPIGGIRLYPALYGPDPKEARFRISEGFVLILALCVELIGAFPRLLLGGVLGGL